MDETILKMERICKRFPGVNALEDVSLEVKRGEVHVLLGENGAGKSTLMKILTGAYSKESGKIYFKGKEISIRNPREGLDIGISMVYQELNLASSLTVAENIFLGSEPLRNRSFGVINRTEIKEKCEKILEELHISLTPQKKLKELGVAQLQMVSIAKAFSSKAEIMILDEPTASLQEEEIDELFSLINKLKKSGVSFIYISHRMEEIPLIGDRITVLRDGKKVGTVDSNTPVEVLIRMMVGRELKELFPKEAVDMGEEVLTVKNLNRKNSLFNINFSLKRGEILGLAGLVGAGRTELARAIFGAEPVDSKEIYIDGNYVEINSPTDAISCGIAYLSENRKLFSLALSMSIFSNITMPSLEEFCIGPVLRLRKEREVSKKFMDKLFIRATSVKQRVKFLSGGNQQKVVLAKWLCSKAKIFIFDEPTMGIDVGTKTEIYKLINLLAKEGAGIVMISSYLPELLAISDSIIVLNKGRIKKEFKREEATQENILYYATV